MERIEDEAERRSGECIGEEGFGGRLCATVGQARRRIDDDAPDLGIGEARVEEMPAVFAAGNVLEAGRALPAHGRGAAPEELGEERQRAAARHRIQAGSSRRRERHLVDVRAGARRDLQPSETGAGIGAERRERDAGRARDPRQREFVLAAADPEGALREVR
jgi:hypothetical protein